VHRLLDLCNCVAHGHSQTRASYYRKIGKIIANIGNRGLSHRRLPNSSSYAGPFNGCFI
jgi:hypothetical protein